MPERRGIVCVARRFAFYFGLRRRMRLFFIGNDVTIRRAVAAQPIGVLLVFRGVNESDV